MKFSKVSIHELLETLRVIFSFSDNVICVVSLTTITSDTLGSVL